MNDQFSDAAPTEMYKQSLHELESLRAVIEADSQANEDEEDEDPDTDLQEFKLLYALRIIESKDVLAVTRGSYTYRFLYAKYQVETDPDFKPVLVQHVAVNPNLAGDDIINQKVRNVIQEYWQIVQKAFDREFHAVKKTLPTSLIWIIICVGLTLASLMIATLIVLRLLALTVYRWFLSLRTLTLI